MSPSPRIAITGSGAVCGAGLRPAAILDAILEGRSAMGPIGYWDASDWPVRLAAQINGVKDQVLVDDRKLHKSISRTDLFGIYAGDEAIRSAGFPTLRDTLPETGVPLFNDRSGLVVGSGGGSYQVNYDFFPLLHSSKGDMTAFGRDLASSVHPMWLLRILPNNVLCHVGIRNQFKGTNACITNQCASGALAVAEAAASLRIGEADRIVAIGHDAPIEPESVLGYHRLGLLSSDAVRPSMPVAMARSLAKEPPPLPWSRWNPPWPARLRSSASFSGPAPSVKLPELSNCSRMGTAPPGPSASPWRMPGSPRRRSG